MTEACILLVDSDVLVRNPLAEYLRECGYRVLEAAGVAEACLLLGHMPEEIDAALIAVDEMSEAAFALASAIRTDHPDIDVMLAGTTARAAETAGDLCEDGPLLGNPYDPQLVLDRIRRLIAARHRRGRGD